jgi:hypothetical protein
MLKMQFCMETWRIPYVNIYIYMEFMTPRMEEIWYADYGRPYMGSGSSNLSETLCLVWNVHLGCGILDVWA